MEKDNFVVSTYPYVVIAALFPNSRKSCREMPVTKKADSSPPAALFLQCMISVVVTLPGCSACGISRIKVYTPVPSRAWLSCNLHIWEVWSDQK